MWSRGEKPPKAQAFSDVPCALEFKAQNTCVSVREKFNIYGIYFHALVGCVVGGSGGGKCPRSCWNLKYFVLSCSDFKAQSTYQKENFFISVEDIPISLEAAVLQTVLLQLF